MRLKELTVQGYKSFASRHRFQFPSGITAVVGPNGSGKSNIADGIRWVLGEQRAVHLRARKSEDLIFHGTERRARAGLAEVTLLVDNGDRWLDLDFPEVAITRRAHRDGTTEFLVNGARVRLRDLLEVLGSQLGQSNYTVIGQGLVDSALALRPEDRRGLVDEAAGVVPLQRKRDRALRQLAETNENLTRVLDILAELGPRLKRMERLAERAQQHRRLAGELEGLLRVWYGYQWHRAAEQLRLARSAREVAAGQAEAEAQAAAALAADLHQAEGRAEAAEDELAGWRAQREALAQATAEARQGLAVSQARLESLTARAAELERERDSLLAETANMVTRSDELATQVASLADVHAGHQADLAAARSALAAAEAEHEALAMAVETARARVFSLVSEMGAQEQKAAALAALVQARSAERDGAAADLAQLHEREAGLAQAADAASRGHADADAALASLLADISSAEAERELVTASLRAARDALAQATTAAAGLRARAGALDALVSELDEVSPVLAQIERAGVRPLGTVASLLEVAPGWDEAVAAALGSRMQGVVLEDQAMVDVALGALAASVGGQVTLVPLRAPDTPPRSWRPRAGQATAGAVASSPRAPELVPTVLGGTAFLDDVADARTALAQPDGPTQVATRDGRLLLAGGIVVAGAPGAELLALQRERRALPAAIAGAVAEEAERAGEVDALVAQRHSIEDRLGDLSGLRARAEAARAAAASVAVDAQAELDRLRRARDWSATACERLNDEVQALMAEAAALDEARARQAPAEAELRAALRALQGELENADLSGARALVTTGAEQAARSAEALAGRRAALDVARKDLAGTRQRLHQVQQREAETHAAIAETSTGIARQEAEARGLAAELALLAARIAPAEAGVRDRRGALRDAAARVEQARRQLAGHEARLTEARLAETRAEDRLERLHDQLRADGEWLPAAADLPAAPDLTAVTSLALPEVKELPAEIERRMGGLRRELRAIGAIDHEALEAHQESVDHFQDLSAQRADLEAAERDLRQVLQQLEAEMQARFDVTFQAVAEAFAQFFPQLFAGGEAALVLTEATGDSPPGIDILARPPGKRRQPLSLLSGGERSLTAVALIFALLKVSRTPFVVLDEVDAALDEANVDRFCAALRDLAEHTQVVIITHNRNTIQVAGTVYGVSMGDDGASQAISLRVEAGQ